LPTPRHHNHRPRQPRSAAGALLAFALAYLPAIATRNRSTLAPSSLRVRLHRSRGRKPDRTADGRALPARATPAATAVCPHPDTTTTGHGTPDRQPVRCPAFALAHLSAIATRNRSTLAPSSPRGRLHRSRERTPGRTAGDRAPPARTTPEATADCPHPDTTTTGHGTPDRQPVRCLAFALAHLPAIATRNRSTLAPSSLCCRLHRSRGRKPGRTADDRAPPARSTPEATLAHACNRCLRAPREPEQATARPIGSRCAVSPSPWPTCRRSPPGTARPWRRCRFVAGFTDREDEGPEELPVIEHRQHGPRRRQPRIARTPRA
jgi:hypothetical protein